MHIRSHNTENKRTREIGPFVVYRSETGTFVAAHQNRVISAEGHSPKEALEAAKEVVEIYDENEDMTV